MIDDLHWFELYVLFWCCPMVPFVPHTCEGLRVLQYVHDSLIVAFLSDRSINPSKGVVAYEIKGT